jgi:hypothetical protein
MSAQPRRAVFSASKTLNPKLFPIFILHDEEAGGDIKGF